MPASSSPVPRPAHSAMSRPASRASRSAAADVLPIPISPSSTTLPGSEATISPPAAIASSHCSAVIATPSDESAVPSPILRTISRGRGSKWWRTPASTTWSASECCSASTLIAAPPARKFSTICHVTSLGYADTPCAARPWSAANTSICGATRRGCSLRRMSPTCSASASMRPSEPTGFVSRSIRCCRRPASAASPIGSMVGSCNWIMCGQVSSDCKEPGTKCRSTKSARPSNTLSSVRTSAPNSARITAGDSNKP